MPRFRGRGGDFCRTQKGRAFESLNLSSLKFKTLVTALLITAGVVILLNGQHRTVNPAWHRGLKNFVGPYPAIAPGAISYKNGFVPCHGIHGSLLTSSSDLFHQVVINSSPKPYAGSYEELGLAQTWLTADDRYRPYGRGEHADDYPDRLIDWERVDWAELQNGCMVRNRERLGGHVKPISSSDRLPPPGILDVSAVKAMKLLRTNKTADRTAIVLRAWSTFDWDQEFRWSLRSLITETALTTGGSYTVYILMDVQSEHMRNHTDLMSGNDDFYDQLLDELVPREFRNMTLLWHVEFLAKWYPAVQQSSVELQMFQALQIFAQAFPDFDHYWQMEMDVRFTGHAGELLDSLALFSRNEPRKQARQRASFSYLPATYDSYSNFTALVNASLNGTDAYYTGIRIPDIPSPLGPSPPSPAPEDDNFGWGVGEEADFLTLYPCNNVSVHHTWPYNYYIHGFYLGGSTPGRVVCPLAVQRCSWNLLDTVHRAQRNQGLAVQSESIMPSFALWHGMKISLPPLPFYSRKDHRHTADELSRFVNGGVPSPEHDGMAWGEWVYGVDGKEFRQHTTIEGGLEPTVRYKTGYPWDLWQAWMSGVDEDYDRDWLPTVVRKADGKVYLPNTIIHPIHRAPKSR